MECGLAPARGALVNASLEWQLLLIWSKAANARQYLIPREHLGPPVRAGFRRGLLKHGLCNAQPWPWHPTV